MRHVCMSMLVGWLKGPNATRGVALCAHATDYQVAIAIRALMCFACLVRTFRYEDQGADIQRLHRLPRWPCLTVQRVGESDATETVQQHSLQ